MSLLVDIAQSYRHPRRVLRKRVAGGPREDRALITLILACALIFLSRWPLLVRQATFEQTDLQPLIGASLLALVFIAPLIFYVLAGLARIVARLFGGKASGFEARMALFWALLAATPFWIFEGLTGGLLGPGPLQQLFGALTLASFMVIWAAGIREVEGRNGLHAATAAPDINPTSGS